MTEAARAAADLQEIHPLLLANKIIDLVNDQRVPYEHRTRVLDGLLHAYVLTAQQCGLLDVAAQVMSNEGARILRELSQQQATAAAMDAAANTPAFVVSPNKLH